MRILPPALLLTILTVGCVSTEATTLATAPSDRPAKVNPDRVTVYTDTSQVQCEFDPVATIRAQGSTSSVSDEKMIDKTKTEAREVGANALIIGTIDTDDPDYNPLMFGGSDYGSREGRYLAVHERRPCTPDAENVASVSRGVKRYLDTHDLSERVSDALLTGQIVSGMSKKQVRLLHGEPDQVVTQDDSERWLYRGDGFKRQILFEDGAVTDLAR